MKRAAELTGMLTPPENVSLSSGIDEIAISDGRDAASLRIIADHARASTFLISDGVVPANEGRGYVLRKILRRGIRHGRLLGQEKPFMHEMVFAVRDEMQVAYPELKETAERVSKTVRAEEEQFARVIAGALRELDQVITAAMFHAIDQLLERDRPLYEQAFHATYSLLDPSSPDLTQYLQAWDRAATPEEIRVMYRPIAENLRSATLRTGHSGVISGANAFFLYETYGLPLDFIADAARDGEVDLDLEGFDKAKEEEQARARASWKGGSQKSAAPVYRELAKTEFEGYTALRVDGAKVLALVKDGVGAAELRAGEAGEV